MAKWNKKDVDQLAKGFASLSRRMQIVVLIVVIVAAVGYVIWINQPPPSSVVPAGELLFMSWNVANYFDDEDDPNNHDTDENEYALNPARFRAKTAALADALLTLNNGDGPDILAVVEVESDKCMNALKDATNALLERRGKGDKKYTDVVFKGDKMGRRFAPGVLSRIKLDANNSKRFGKSDNGRQLLTHAVANGHDLVIIAAHWTSRVREDTARRRLSYAQDSYGQFREVVNADPDAAVIVCGDFNDEFMDESMQKGLHASDNREAVMNAIPPAAEPLPLVLWDGNGTICYRGDHPTFDHICISRGLFLDAGWSYVPNSFAVANGAPFADSKGCPLRFDPKDGKGLSDHFPVTIRLRVAP